MPRPLLVVADEVVELERRLAEEMVAALAAQLQQRALDRADGLLRDIAVFERQFVGPLAAMDQHGLQVVEVEQQQALLVGDVEGDGEDAFLHLVEVHQPASSSGPISRDRGADRVALLAEQVPELDRDCRDTPVGLSRSRRRARRRLSWILPVGDPAIARPDSRPSRRRRRSGRRRPKALDDALQGDGLAGAGGARDQSVTVGALELELLWIPAACCAANEDPLVASPAMRTPSKIRGAQPSPANPAKRVRLFRSPALARGRDIEPDVTRRKIAAADQQQDALSAGTASGIDFRSHLGGRGDGLTVDGHDQVAALKLLLGGVAVRIDRRDDDPARVSRQTECPCDLRRQRLQGQPKRRLPPERPDRRPPGSAPGPDRRRVDGRAPLPSDVAAP